MGGGDSGSSDNQQVTQTAAQVQQQRTNAELWNYYQTDYKPIVDKYIAKTMDSTIRSEEAGKVAGQINAEVMKNVNPAAVTGNAVKNAKTLNSVASMGTGTQVQGQGGERSKQIASTQNIVDIGRGEATTVGAGESELAAQSLQAEISNLEIQQQEQAAIENSYGSVAGAVGAGLLKAGQTKTQPRVLNTVSSGSYTNPSFAADPALKGSDLAIW